ncbi:MAG: hypothetical protein JSR91_11425 [Proteobacteria bacterium]|nr:hypothetical protein [Pseudomonadota bacterium]
MDLLPPDAAGVTRDPKRRHRPLLRRAFQLLLVAAYLLGLVIIVKLVGTILDMP